eukprot:gnl/TRDRNA2_/TRDRNA2_177880_c1_seq24.p1 gnl/TRDRNA2_/TRDRNA2_177880_c1~~gnl/TRDRNA2_/TRDRNA2_177880_c1_seq24.p1  ORF type:complete len:121 (+),score=5.28 gnl/TRDRNA2_/TRDRNA2_177880_c1_seq24:101-463(+)
MIFKEAGIKTARRPSRTQLVNARERLMSPFNLADTSTLSEFVTQSLPRVSGRSDKKMPRHHQLNEALSAFRNPTSRPTLFLVPSSPKLCLHSRSHRGRIDLRIETCPSFAVVTKLRSARS